MQKMMGPVNTLPTAKEAMRMIDDAFCFETSSEEVDIKEALGRVLAEDIEASEYVPGFNRSAMDGYSVIAADTKGASDDAPVKLRLAGQVLMGCGADLPIEKGTCVYTPTGAAVPKGTESVVMVEDTTVNKDGTISIFKEISAGKNVITKGDDVTPGKKIFESGRLLKISDLGSLAALGKSRVKVVRRPVVGILVTGDEIVGIDEAPKDGQVRDVHSTTLTLLVEASGAVARLYGVIKDNEDLLRQKLKTALKECDMVLISGGSSMGEKDSTEKVIDEAGEVILHGIKIKPGKPTIIGRAEDKPVIGVPGHPVSAFFITRVFVKKLIGKMLGIKNEELFVKAILTGGVKVNKKRMQFCFASLHTEDGKTYAEPFNTKSGLITSLAGADVFFALGDEDGDKNPGDEITVYLI